MTNPTYTIFVCFLLSFSVSTYAETQLDLDLAEHSNINSGFYLGLDLATSISGELTAKNVDTDNEESANIDVSSKAIFIGYRTQSNNRVQLSRSAISMEYENGDTDDITGTELDFHYVYGQDSIKPYIGFGFGYYSLEDSGEYLEGGDDLNGISFQLLGGVKFDIHEHVELDVSLKVKSIAWEEIMFFDSLEVVQLTHNYSSLNFGAAYMF
jgi:opacity protein-like surface antigen